MVRARTLRWSLVCLDRPAPSLELIVTFTGTAGSSELDAPLASRWLPWGTYQRLLPIVPDKRIDLGTDFHILLQQCEPSPRSVLVNPEELFTEFQRLNRDIGSLATFLKKCQLWSEGTRRFTFNNEGDSSHCSHLAMLAEDFWDQQQSLRQMLDQGRHTWSKPGGQPSLAFRARAEYPHLVHTDRTCLDGIHSWAALELLHGAEYGICENVGCGRRFRLGSRPKHFCGSKCIHNALVSRGRKKKLMGKSN